MRLGGSAIEGTVGFSNRYYGGMPWAVSIKVTQ